MTAATETLDSILARLEKVRPAGDGYMASCPAHDDLHPSLSVSLGHTGKPLLHCHAGCSYQAVIAALGIDAEQAVRVPGPVVQGSIDYELIDPTSGDVIMHRRINHAGGGKHFVYLRNGQSGLQGLHTADLPLYGMSETVEAESGSVVVLVEGETSRDALAERGVLSVGTACGAGVTPSDEQLSHLTPFRVILWPDNDDVGRQHMSRIGERLLALGIEVFWLDWPDAPEHGDAADFTEDDAVLHDLADQAPPFVPISEAPWPVRAPKPTRRPAVPELPLELLPAPLSPWIADAAELMAIPPEMIAIPALVALSMLVARIATICPNGTDDWIVVPNLWGGVVARPGTLKSPTQKQALSFLDPLIERAHDEYAAGRADATADRQILDEEIKDAKRRLRRLLKDESERSAEDRARLVDEKTATADLLDGVDLDGIADFDGPETIDGLRQELSRLEEDRGEEQTERRYVVNDATVEKLGELLISNPQGLLLTRDELAGFLAALQKQGRDGDREFYLEAWSGDSSFNVDRIKRGSMHIKTLRLAIVGTIQPSKLEHHLGDALSHGRGDDGMLRRFQLLVWPDSLPPYTQARRRADHGVKQRVLRIAEALDRMAVQGGDIVQLCFRDDAQQLQDQWRSELEARLRDGSLDDFPAFASYVSKHRSLMPSLALIFHVIEVVDTGATLGPVPLDCVRRAAAFVDLLEAHARKIYADELEPHGRSAVALASRIEAGDIPDGMSVRDIERARWAALGTRAAVDYAVQELEQRGWCRTEETESGPTGGRPSSILRLHRELRQS